MEVFFVFEKDIGILGTYYVQYSSEVMTGEKKKEDPFPFSSLNLNFSRCSNLVFLSFLLRRMKARKRRKLGSRESREFGEEVDTAQPLMHRLESRSGEVGFGLTFELHSLGQWVSLVSILCVSKVS